jgi:hypothetical protein
MKRLLLLGILLVAFANSGISQITITQSDMPQSGDTLRVSTTTDSTGLPTPSMTGAGITWNYSALIPHSQGVDTFLNVSSTPLGYQFYFNDAVLYPNYASTVAQSGVNFPALGGVTITSVINYFKDEASNYESVGYGATINSLPTSVKDDTIDVVYQFPMNYGNKDSCHSSNGVSIATLAYYGTNQYRVNHVDGWGTITTPYGTFSALRVKTFIYLSDSIYVHALSLGFRVPQPEQIEYKWLANGQHVPVLQINETTGIGATRQYIYRDSMRNGLLAVSEINSAVKNLSLYPNPATENTTISYALANSSLVNINVYSVDGRCVSKIFNGEQSTGNHTISVNVNNLQSGIYMLEIESNGTQTVKKLVVVK